MKLWHRHKWTDWLVTDTGTITYWNDRVGWYLTQQRHCLSCGKTDVKDRAEYAGAPPSRCNRVSLQGRAVPQKDGVRA